MGADLYIKSLQEVCQEKNRPLFDKWVKKRDALGADVPEDVREAAQKKVTYYYDKMYEKGYFRDSYNSTSVLWTLGLSWWTDVTEMLDDEGNLTPEKAVELVTMIESKKQKLPTKRELLDGHATVSDEGEDSVASWHKFYKEKKERLIQFLAQAIELGEPIHCSL